MNDRAYPEICGIAQLIIEGKTRRKMAIGRLDTHYIEQIVKYVGTHSYRKLKI